MRFMTAKIRMILNNLSSWFWCNCTPDGWQVSRQFCPSRHSLTGHVSPHHLLEVVIKWFIHPSLHIVLDNIWVSFFVHISIEWSNPSDHNRRDLLSHLKSRWKSNASLQTQSPKCLFVLQSCHQRFFTHNYLQICQEW